MMRYATPADITHGHCDVCSEWVELKLILPGRHGWVDADGRPYTSDHRHTVDTMHAARHADPIEV